MVFAYQDETVPWEIDVFESKGWPEEGIPVISFKSDKYQFCKIPKRDISCVEKAVETGIKMSFYTDERIVSSRYITIKPVVMRAKIDFIIENKIKIIKGQEIIKLQYGAEGFHALKINGKIHDVFLDDYADLLENSLVAPEVEWWVNILGKGWLLLTNDNVNYHRRRY